MHCRLAAALKAQGKLAAAQAAAKAAEHHATCKADCTAAAKLAASIAEQLMPSQVSQHNQPKHQDVPSIVAASASPGAAAGVGLVLAEYGTGQDRSASVQVSNNEVVSGVCRSSSNIQDLTVSRQQHNRAGHKQPCHQVSQHLVQQGPPTVNASTALHGKRHDDVVGQLLQNFANAIKQQDSATSSRQPLHIMPVYSGQDTSQRNITSGLEPSHCMQPGPELFDSSIKLPGPRTPDRRLGKPLIEELPTLALTEQSSVNLES